MQFTARACQLREGGREAALVVVVVGRTSEHFVSAQLRRLATGRKTEGT
jgi:hypothetical protein